MWRAIFDTEKMPDARIALHCRTSGEGAVLLRIDRRMEEI